MILRDLTHTTPKYAPSQQQETLPKNQDIQVTSITIDTLLKNNGGQWAPTISAVGELLTKALKDFLPQGTEGGALVKQSAGGLEFKMTNPVSGGYAQGELSRDGSITIVSHNDGPEALVIAYGPFIKAVDQKTDLFPNRDIFATDTKGRSICISNIIESGGVAVPYRLGTSEADKNEQNPSRWKDQERTKFGIEPLKIGLTSGFYTPTGSVSAELQNQAYVQSLSVVISDQKREMTQHYAGQAANTALSKLDMDPQFRSLIIRTARGGELPS